MQARRQEQTAFQRISFTASPLLPLPSPLNTPALMQQQASPEYVANFCSVRFPGQIPKRLVIAEELKGNVIDLEGRDLVVVEVGHTGPPGIFHPRSDHRNNALARSPVVRLLFPIHDLRGRIVGFGGRVIGEGEPKYLNSSDSEVFHKGQLLFVEGRLRNSS